MTWNTTGGIRGTYWGAALTGDESNKVSMGAVPAGGSWVRMEVPANLLPGIEGSALSALELSRFDGEVWFDRFGKAPGGSGSLSRPSHDVLLARAFTDNPSANLFMRFRNTLRRSFGLTRVNPPLSLSVHAPIALSSSTDAHRYSLYTPELNLMTETEQTTAATPAIAYEHIWFGGQPVAQFDTATNTAHWTFTDHLGTPILQTNASGAVDWRVEYEPYGTVTAVRTGATRHQTLRFPGQEFDEAAADRSYNIFRWYREGWGRYTQRDPVGLAGGLNLFGYSAANPTDYFDSSGLCRVEIHFSRVGPKKLNAYHAYITTTDQGGTNFFRGGPSSQGCGSAGAAGGSASGSCCRHSESGNSANGTSPGFGRGGPGKNNGPYGPIIGTSGPYLPGTVDYPQPGEAEPSSIVLRDDGSPCWCNTCFQRTLADIERRSIPYNPFPWNSNSVVHELLETCALNSSEPPYRAPGWSNQLP